MAKPIKPTPVLLDEEAEKFDKEAEDNKTKKLPKNEIIRAEFLFRKIKENNPQTLN